jgi:hypothetical protein
MDNTGWQYTLRPQISGYIASNLFEGHRQNSAFLFFLPIFVGYSAQFSVPQTISSYRDHRNIVRVSLLKQVFCPFSWAIAHIFRFSGRFPSIVTIGTWFEWCRQNTYFSCFLPIFVGYSAQFLVPRTILATVYTDTWFEGHRETSFFMFYAHFRGL